jgi:hypothetical protein
LQVTLHDLVTVVTVTVMVLHRNLRGLQWCNRLLIFELTLLPRLLPVPRCPVLFLCLSSPRLHALAIPSLHLCGLAFTPLWPQPHLCAFVALSLLSPHACICVPTLTCCPFCCPWWLFSGILRSSSTLTVMFVSLGPPIFHFPLRPYPLPPRHCTHIYPEYRVRFPLPRVATSCLVYYIACDVSSSPRSDSICIPDIPVPPTLPS